MIDEDALRVWCGPHLVGHLWRDGQDRLGFQYEPDWLKAGFRLSTQLPLTTEPFAPEAGQAHFFFRNLLPEAGARQRLVASRRLSDSDFVLLREFGGDCAGALSILPCETEPDGGSGYQVLSGTELHELVLRRGTVIQPPGAGPRPRLSLAGAQDKCPVLLRDGEYALPQGVAASSHILKFQVPDYRHVPLYEAFLGEMARAAGIPAAPSYLDSIEEEKFLVVERYDRFWRDGEVQRLHQEDFLQALGPGFRDKYQAQGGPGLSECIELVRRYSEQPAHDLLQLLRWHIFNVLAGNSDAHAKNLSLCQVGEGEERWRLAPFYDLVCTRAIERIDATLAMAVGEQFNPELVGESDWRELARHCALAERLVLREVRQLAGILPELFNATLLLFEARYGEQPALQRVRQVIEQQCARVTK
jgi:serine/threonine-protein kinase HipA